MGYITLSLAAVWLTGCFSNFKFHRIEKSKWNRKILDLYGIFCQSIKHTKPIKVLDIWNYRKILQFKVWIKILLTYKSYLIISSIQFLILQDKSIFLSIVMIIWYNKKQCQKTAAEELTNYWILTDIILCMKKKKERQII